VWKGKHGARSAKQAIAIGLSKASRAGGKLPLPPGRKAITATGRRPNPACSRAAHRALEREGSASVSHKALSRHPRSRARDRGGAQMRKTAAKAVRTKGAAGRREAALAGSGSGESLTAGMSIIPCALRSAVLLPAVIGIEPARSVLEINASALLRVVFLVIALVAALLGLGGIAAAFAGIAKILFVLFLILFLLSLVTHLGRRV